jgi:ribonuclease P protein subunit POP4
MRNPENILRHELIGLQCTIKEASNKAQRGLNGKIVDENMKSIVIESNGRKMIPKKGTTFAVKLSNKIVEIDGNFIIARPEDRIKKKIKKW